MLQCHGIFAYESICEVTIIFYEHDRAYIPKYAIKAAMHPEKLPVAMHPEKLPVAGSVGGRFYVCMRIIMRNI